MASSWSLHSKTLPLKVNWSISRGSLLEKENLFVTFKDDGLEGVGEIAFLTHGKLGVSEVQDHFENFRSMVPGLINGLDDLTGILGRLEIPNSLRFAIESSYVHYLAQLMESSQQRVLGVREVSRIATSHSVPIMKAEDVRAYIDKLQLNRFHCLKVKVKEYNDYRLIREVAKSYGGKIRIDGNECFNEAREVLDFTDELSGLAIEFIEQPLPRFAHEEAIKLREKSRVMLIADEAIQDGPIIDDYQKMYHGVNIKLMKAGSYIKALNQLREARLLGMKTMLGCMVETSLGISSAMNIGHGVDFFDLDGFLLLEKDPYQLVYEEKGMLYYSHNI